MPSSRPEKCPRCEQEGTCPRHLTFLRRAREAGQPPPEPVDIGPSFITPERARQLRLRAQQTQVIASYVPPRRELTHEETRWTLRGQPRTRATFSQPHPADFPGGLPQPPEYPEDTGRP